MSARPSRKIGRKRGKVVASITLVSLMDLFTIVLIFLLQSFSSTGETFTSSPTFTLPTSTAVSELVPRLTIQVTQNDILVDGRKTASVEDALKAPSLLIEPLKMRLDEEAKKSIYIAGINRDLQLTREVILFGDKEIPFVLLEKVMYTCGLVGYSNIKLAVISKGG